MSSRVLLHICCGPCALSPLGLLKDKGYEVMGYFYNPNIHPLQEYLKRVQAVEQVADKMEIRVIFNHKEYHPEIFLRRVVFREEQRCMLCYQSRLERTRNIALKGGFDFFSTTLLFSKRQKHDLIKTTGESLSTKKTAFLYEDFRQGWNQGRDSAREMEIYTQNYCGCIYSEFERFHKELDNI